MKEAQINNSYIIDTHVHFYPCYDPLVFFNSAIENLNLISPASIPVICLTERVRENFFCLLQKGDVTGVTISETACSATLKVEVSNKYIYVVSGFQYCTYERLEFLSLGTNTRLLERLSLDEYCQYAVDNDIFGVIPWSFGKWLGKRRRVILTIIDKFQSYNNIQLGDIYNHPWWFYEPVFKRWKHSTGKKIMYGSDTLPISGQERGVGKAAVQVLGEDLKHRLFGALPHRR